MTNPTKTTAESGSKTAGEQKAQMMELLFLRGYNPEAGIENKILSGDVAKVDEKTGRMLIKAGIATFPDDEE